MRKRDGVARERPAGRRTRALWFRADSCTIDDFAGMAGGKGNA